MTPVPWRRYRTLWRVVGSVLAAFFLLTGVLRVVDFLATTTTTVDEVFDAAELTELRVYVADGNVVIVGTDADTVSVTGTVTSGLLKTGHEERVEGDRIVVDTTCPGGPLRNECGADYRIEVPRDLAVVVRSGDVSPTLRDLAGRVDVEVSNNPVVAERLSGPVRLVTWNDSVDARDLASTDVEITTSNDRVGVEFSTAPDRVRIRTSNDEVDVVVPDTTDFYSVQLSTTNGEQRNEVRSDPASRRSIDVETSNDDIVVAYPRG